MYVCDPRTRWPKLQVLPPPSPLPFPSWELWNLGTLNKYSTVPTVVRYSIYSCICALDLLGAAGRDAIHAVRVCFGITKPSRMPRLCQVFHQVHLCNETITAYK
jgi:hypothetical protein